MEDVDVDIDSEEQENNSIVEENNGDSPSTDTNTNISILKENKEHPSQRQKFLRLPLARIKTMMKKDPDCGLISLDAVFLVTKATEMFIEHLTVESGKQLAIMGKRKTVMRKDVDTVIQNCPQLCFLDGALE